MGQGIADLEYQGDTQSNDAAPALHRPAYPTDPRQVTLSLGTPEPTTSPPGVDLQQAATVATRSSSEKESSSENAEPAPAVGAAIEDTSAPQQGSTSGEGHYTPNGRQSESSCNAQDSRSHRGPSAKRKISVEEWQRSRRPSPQSLRQPPQPLTICATTPPDPEWDSPEPQYDRYGVQIFPHDAEMDAPRVRA